MMRELRCGGNILHGLVVDEEEPKAQGVIEFRCRSQFCGKRAGVVVLHRFDLSTGECVTHRYLEPNHTEGSAYGTSHKRPPIRLS